jgi:uroporphyrinogen decarboxylase
LLEDGMSMTHKERMRRSLWHEPIDRLPTQINYTRAMGQKLAALQGVSLEELPARLGNHFLRLDLSYEHRDSDDCRIAYDWWGVGFDKQEEGYFVAIHPLTESKDLSDFPWPDPCASGLLDGAKATLSQDDGRHFVAPNFGFALFERAWALRGFDTFLMDMALDPSFAEDLLERITEIQVVLIRRFLDLGVDGGYFGDDYGAQDNMLFSPRMWRQMIKPRLARMFALFREANLPILMHSDGQIAEILPDLVEIGLTAYNPVQPEVVDHAWLRGTFGQRLAYYGGISTQTVLPQGTSLDVRQAVSKCVAALAPERTGLLVAPSHRLMSDIPMANVDALLDSFAALGDVETPSGE